MLYFTGATFAKGMLNPSAFVIGLALFLSNPPHLVAQCVFFALLNSQLIWAATLQKRDAAALSHLRSVLKSGGKVQRFTFSDYFPGADCPFEYDILHIEKYKTYAAIQHGNYKSFIIIPFLPAQASSFRLFWLLHECGHIGTANRQRGLYLEVSRFLAMGIFLPAAIALGYGSPWYTTIVTIVGGVLSGPPHSPGLLNAEMEADYNAILLAQMDPIAQRKILDWPGLTPPPDRKMSPGFNKIRADSFDGILQAARSNTTIPPEKHFAPVMRLYAITSVPLLVFVMSLSVFQYFRDPIDIHSAIRILALGIPCFGLLLIVAWYYKRSLLKEIRSIVDVSGGIHRRPDPKGSIASA
ncbi:hypothetical protein [Ensifer sp. Root558]|uniref:hypothetical protein n=1 Tax=Ensifer sp. Root558 TaxID=1736558 RepID=UPI0012E85063|nr:hypothetical protein [Ensifer sp. Root558]